MTNKLPAEFIDGLIIKRAREGAPDFIKGSLSIKRQDLIDWLNSKSEEWINADLKVSKAGKLYFQVDNWKKEKAEREAVEGKPENPYKIDDNTEMAMSMSGIEYPDDDVNPEDIPF